MNAEMDIAGIIAEVDALLEAGEDAEVEKKLIGAVNQCIQSEPDNVVGQSALLNELGGFYRSKGIFDKGERAYLKAKSLLEETRKYARIVDGPAVPGCCACNPYGGLCGVNGSGNRQRHTEIVYTNNRMTVHYATTLNNLAGLYRMNRQFQQAIDIFDAAISVYDSCEGEVSPDVLASCYNNRGLVYLDTHEAHKAKAMFLKAKEILERGGDYKFALGTTLSNLGFVSVLEKDDSEAVNLFRKAIGLFTEIGNTEMIRNCEKLLVKLKAIS